MRASAGSWYPDTVWAPSWVTWRYSDNYCGWAPLPPRTTYQAGVGIVYNGGMSVDFGFGLGANCFTFVPTRYFCDPHPHHYFVAAAQMTQIYKKTTVINNYNLNHRTIVNHGIPVETIADATRTPIRPVPVHQINNAFANGHSQPFNRSSYASGANHVAYMRDLNSPLRTPVAPQNPFPQAAPRPNNAVATMPQRPAPTVNYHSQPQAAPLQTPQSTPAQWEQTGTPRNASHNYEPRENSYHPPAVAAPSSSQPQLGGNHNGSQNWPSH